LQCDSRIRTDADSHFIVCADFALIDVNLYESLRHPKRIVHRRQLTEAETHSQRSVCRICQWRHALLHVLQVRCHPPKGHPPAQWMIRGNNTLSHWTHDDWRL